jgi:DedD protein
MAENRRGKENRFYFSRGQLVLLGGAFVVASVVIFFIGMFVGKGIEERKILKRDEPLVKIPVKPTPQGSSGAPATPPKEEITFNESVSKSPTPPLTEEKVKEEKPPVKAETPAVNSPEKKVDKSVPAEAPVKPTAATETAAPKDNGKMWRAQVNAYPDERSAKQIVDRLKNKGYNAYVSEAQNKGKTWYRVNVGKYGSREEADKVVEVLKSKENFTKAFAASK